MPDVTVVIPTRDRWAILARTLDALARQDLGGFDAEVVVVGRLAREAAPELPGVRVVAEPVPGAAAARNRGIAEAAGRIVVFIGDDCIPADAGFLRGHAEAHPDDGVRRAVTGRIEWDPSVERTAVMDWLERRGHMVDMERLLGASRRARRPSTRATFRWRVRRCLEVAGFDQRFSGYGFEDLELALRLGDRGIRFEHRPGVGVLHSHHYSLERSLERMEAVGRGARLLHTIHDHRPAPRRGCRQSRLRCATGRALALLRADLGLRAAHLAAFTRGYVAAPLDDHPSLRGYGAVPRFEGASAWAATCRSCWSSTPAATSATAPMTSRCDGGATSHSGVTGRAQRSCSSERCCSRSASWRPSPKGSHPASPTDGSGCPTSSAASASSLSGHLAMLDVGGGHVRVLVHVLTWWVVAINQLGSILFFLAGVAAFVRPATSSAIDAGLVNWGTFAGAVCFAIGGVVQLFDKPTTTRTVVRHTP